MKVTKTLKLNNTHFGKAVHKQPPSPIITSRIQKVLSDSALVEGNLAISKIHMHLPFQLGILLLGTDPECLQLH